MQSSQLPNRTSNHQQTQSTQLQPLTPQQIQTRLEKLKSILVQLQTSATDDSTCKTLNTAINIAKSIECQSLKPQLYSVITKYVITSESNENSLFAWKLSIHYLKCLSSIDEIVRFKNLVLDYSVVFMESFISKIQKITENSSNFQSDHLDTLTLLIMLQDTYLEIYISLLNEFIKYRPIYSNFIKGLLMSSFSIIKQLNNYRDIVNTLTMNPSYNFTTDNLESPAKLMEKVYKKVEQLINSFREYFAMKDFLDSSTSIDDISYYCSELFRLFEMGIDSSKAVLMNLYKTLETFLNNHSHAIDHIEYRSIFEKTLNSALYNISEYTSLLSKNETDKNQDKKKYLKLSAFYSKCVFIFYKLFSNNFLSLESYINLFVKTYSQIPPHSKIHEQDIDHVKELLQNFNESFQLLLSNHSETVINYMFPWLKNGNQQQLSTEAKNQLILTTLSSQKNNDIPLFGKLKILLSLFNGEYTLANYYGSTSSSYLGLLMVSFDILPHCMKDIERSESFLYEFSQAQLNFLYSYPGAISPKLFIQLSKYITQSNHHLTKKAVSSLWRYIVVIYIDYPAMVQNSLNFIIEILKSFQTKYIENLDEFFEGFQIILSSYQSNNTYQDLLYNKLVNDYIEANNNNNNFIDRPILPILYFKSLEEKFEVSISSVKKNVEEQLIPQLLKSLTLSLEGQSYNQMENILLLLDSINLKLPLHLKSQIIIEYMNLLQSLSELTKPPRYNTIDCLILNKLSSLSSSILPKQIQSLITPISMIDSSNTVEICSFLLAILNAGLYEQLDQNLNSTISYIQRTFSRLTKHCENWIHYLYLQNTIETYSRYFSLKSLPSPLTSDVRIMEKPRYFICPIPTIPISEDEINSKYNDLLLKYINHLGKDIKKFKIIDSNSNSNSININSNSNGYYNIGQTNGTKSQMDLMSPPSTAKPVFISHQRTCSDSIENIKKSAQLFFDSIDSNSVDRVAKSRLRKELDELCSNIQAKLQQ